MAMQDLLKSKMVGIGVLIKMTHSQLKKEIEKKRINHGDSKTSFYKRYENINIRMKPHHKQHKDYYLDLIQPFREVISIGN